MVIFCAKTARYLSAIVNAKYMVPIQVVDMHTNQQLANRCNSTPPYHCPSGANLATQSVKVEGTLYRGPGNILTRNQMIINTCTCCIPLLKNK